MIRYNKNKLFYILLIIFIYIYGSLYQINSFGPGDDLVLVETFKNGNIFQLIKNFFLEKTHLLERPISTIFLVTIHFVFKEIFQLYLIAFFSIFLITNFLIYKSLKKLISSKILKTFLLLSLTPFFTSSYIQSPYLLAEFILPIFFWSISFYFLTLSFKTKKNYFLFSNIFLMLSLMCTAIAFPLFILNLLVPIIFLRKNLNFKFFFTKILIPIIFTLFLYFGYLKFINYIFVSDTYGLATISLTSLFKGLYFFVTIFIEFPILILESLIFTNFIQFSIILILVSLFFIFLDKKYFTEGNYLFNYTDKKFFLIILIISLFANFLIFFISGYPSITYGYYNRMLISAFISLSLILSIMLNFKRNTFFLILKIIVVTLILNSSKVVSNQMVKIDVLKKNNIISLTNSLKNYTSKDEKNVLVANLPLYLDNNYNNLEIFWLTWDLDQILKRNNIFFYKSFPLSDYILQLNNYNPAHNFYNHLDILKEENISSYIYYENKNILVFKELEDILDFLNSKKNLKKKLIHRENLRFIIKSYAIGYL